MSATTVPTADMLVEVINDLACQVNHLDDKMLDECEWQLRDALDADPIDKAAVWDAAHKLCNQTDRMHRTALVIRELVRVIVKAD